MNADKFAHIVKQVTIGIYESLEDVMRLHRPEFSNAQAEVIREVIREYDLPIRCLPMVSCDECR